MLAVAVRAWAELGASRRGGRRRRRRSTWLVDRGGGWSARRISVDALAPPRAAFEHLAAEAQLATAPVMASTPDHLSMSSHLDVTLAAAGQPPRSTSSTAATAMRACATSTGLTSTWSGGRGELEAVAITGDVLAAALTTMCYSARSETPAATGSPGHDSMRVARSSEPALPQVRSSRLSRCSALPPATPAYR